MSLPSPTEFLNSLVHNGLHTQPLLAILLDFTTMQGFYSSD